jgi:putative peptide zinc metalloprotease protein
MSESLFSPVWFQVAELKVRLRRQADIHRHCYRGEIWYVLQDHVTGQFHRFNKDSWQLIGLLDGKHTLQQVWDIAGVKLGKNMPTQDEVLQLLSQLYRANVLQSNTVPDIAELGKRQKDYRSKEFMQRIKSPLSIRIPLLDPDIFLTRTLPLVNHLFSWVGGLLWLLLVVVGGFLAVTHWGALSSSITDQVLATESLLLIALTYPFIKTFHELGHAYAIKKWGGEVHEIGIMLLVLFPVPYVEASASTAFRSKYQRMVVGAAGIMVELAIASIALMVWLAAEPGALRVMAFNAMLISGLSTLFFNGNPLLRFDGYYVLADYLEIPNLAQRSNRYLGYLVYRYILRQHRQSTPASSWAEACWLAFYAVASFLYRMFVMMAIALFVASKYLLPGIVLALWSLWMTIILPAMKMLIKPYKDNALRGKRLGIYLAITALFFTFFALLFLMPVPLSSTAQAVVLPPEQAMLRAGERGYLSQWIGKNGDKVMAGQLVAVLKASELDAQIQLLSAQLKEADARYRASVRDRAASDVHLEESQYIEKQYQRALERRESLMVRTRMAGRLILPAAADQLGSKIARGETLGYVMDQDTLALKAVVPNSQIDLVRSDTQAVRIRFASAIHNVVEGEILRVVPQSTRDLPSTVLSIKGGGDIALDPASKDKEQSFQHYFLVELATDAKIPAHIHERVYVLFEHSPEPVAYRLYRSVRRVFLRQFRL